MKPIMKSSKYLLSHEKSIKAWIINGNSKADRISESKANMVYNSTHLFFLYIFTKGEKKVKLNEISKI